MYLARLDFTSNHICQERLEYDKVVALYKRNWLATGIKEQIVRAKSYLYHFLAHLCLNALLV